MSCCVAIACLPSSYLPVCLQRNYHIFYELLAAARLRLLPPALEETLGLGGGGGGDGSRAAAVCDYRFLLDSGSGSGGHSAATEERTDQVRDEDQFLVLQKVQCSVS